MNCILIVCCFVCFQHTPLMIACMRGNADVVMVLLKYGASVTLTDDRSYNALDLAVEKGRWYVHTYIIIHVIVHVHVSMSIVYA